MDSAYRGAGHYGGLIYIYIYTGCVRESASLSSSLRASSLPFPLTPYLEIFVDHDIVSVHFEAVLVVDHDTQIEALSECAMTKSISRSSCSLRPDP